MVLFFFTLPSWMIIEVSNYLNLILQECFSFVNLLQWFIYVNIIGLTSVNYKHKTSASATVEMHFKRYHQIDPCCLWLTLLNPRLYGICYVYDFASSWYRFKIAWLRWQSRPWNWWWTLSDRLPLWASFFQATQFLQILLLTFLQVVKNEEIQENITKMKTKIYPLSIESQSRQDHLYFVPYIPRLFNNPFYEHI